MLNVKDMTAPGLRLWRKHMDLTQPEAADALGASYRTYQRWESGRAFIPRIVAVACIGVDVLLKMGRHAEAQRKKNPPERAGQGGNELD